MDAFGYYRVTGLLRKNNLLTSGQEPFACEGLFFA